MYNRAFPSFSQPGRFTARHFSVYFSLTFTIQEAIALGFYPPSLPIWVHSFHQSIDRSTGIRFSGWSSLFFFFLPDPQSMTFFFCINGVEDTQSNNKKQIGSCEVKKDRGLSLALYTTFTLVNHAVLLTEEETMAEKAIQHTHQIVNPFFIFHFDFVHVYTSHCFFISFVAHALSISGGKGQYFGTRRSLNQSGAFVFFFHLFKPTCGIIK